MFTKGNQNNARNDLEGLLWLLLGVLAGNAVNLAQKFSFCCK